MPQNHGYGRDRTEKEYAIHDTKMALNEAKRKGIVPFCLTELAVPTTIHADLLRLNTAFDLVRYPDPASGLAPVDAVTLERARLDVEAAARVVQWVRSQLGV